MLLEALYVSFPMKQILLKKSLWFKRYRQKITKLIIFEEIETLLSIRNI